MQNFRVLVKQLFYGNEIQFFRKKFIGDFFVKKKYKGNPYKNEPRSNLKGILYEGFVLISVKPTPPLVNIALFVIILSAFKLTFRSTHSSLNLTTTPHYVLMSELPPYLPTYLPTYLPPAKRFFNFSVTWHT